MKQVICGAVGAWLRRLALAQLLAAMMIGGAAQGITTATVQGTIYLANGQPGSGTVVVRWPTFTTAGGQAVAAGSITERVGSDGYLSVNLAPNAGSTPGGEYYTAVFYLNDGSSSTEYRWLDTPQLLRVFSGSICKSAG